MSRRSLAVLVIVLLAGAAARARAQERQRYERRVDSLAAALRVASTARVAYEQRHARNYDAFDTVTAGPLRVLVPRTRAAGLAPAVRAAYRQLEPQYGHALDTLASTIFVARRQPVSGLESADTALVLVAEVVNGTERLPQVVVPDAAIVTAAVRDAALKALVRIDGGLLPWLPGPWPVDTAPASAWARARLDLVSSQTRAARDCYAGDVRACRLVLGIDSVADPARDLLDPADRRRVVQELSERRYSHLSVAALQQCQSGVDSACVSLLRGSHVSETLTSSHRRALVQLAAAIGGPGAMQRLLLTDGTTANRIAAAARIPTDAVVRAWLARVNDRPAPATQLSPVLVASSFGWILLCGAMALKSSRWR